MRLMKSGLRKLISKKSQLYLDAGCGGNKQRGCIGMDKRKLPGVDVVHDIEELPWPFPSNTFDRIIMSHVMEHIKPWIVMDLMNDIWRVMKPEGQIFLVMPYAGSFGHYMDPTHIKPWNEATPQYFDPEFDLYRIYNPKPWKIDINAWHSDGNIEIVMSKRRMNGKH